MLQNASGKILKSSQLPPSRIAEKSSRTKRKKYFASFELSLKGMRIYIYVYAYIILFASINILSGRVQIALFCGGRRWLVRVESRTGFHSNYHHH